MLSFYSMVLEENPILEYRPDLSSVLLVDLRSLIANFHNDIKDFGFGYCVDEELSVVSALVYVLNSTNTHDDEEYFVEDFLISVDNKLSECHLPTMEQEERWAFSQVLFSLFVHLALRYKDSSSHVAYGTQWAYAGKIAGSYSFYPITPTTSPVAH